MQYPIPFTVEPNFRFKNSTVDGFKCSKPDQHKNISIVEYTSDSSFTLRLVLTAKKEELYIIKGKQKESADSIAESVNDSPQGEPMEPKDEFAMPVIKF